MFENMDSVIIKIAFAVSAYAVLTMLQLALHRVRLVRQIFISLNLLFLTGVISFFLFDRLREVQPHAADGIRAAFLCLSAYVGIRLLDVWMFEVIIRRRRHRPIPVVVRDIIRWVIVAVSLFFILKMLYPKLNLSILAFSSLVMGYIVGNATQDTLGNLISGLALNTETPFSIGDWVMIGGHTGRVVEMTWRATRLRTKMSDHVIIPNSAIAREPIVNYSRPTVRHGLKLEIGVSYEVPPNKLRRVILEVLSKVPEILGDPRPRVRLTSYGDFSINYIVRFFVTDFENLDDIMSDVMYLVWYHFKREGIVIPFPIRDVRISRGEEPTDAVGPEEPDGEAHAAILRDIGLFRPLSEDDVRLMAANLQEQIFASGETLVKQGDEGQTFYIVKSGEVRVCVKIDGRETVLTKLTAGDYFGEMCLLTGERRSASVVAESDTRVLVLSHVVLQRVLESNVALAEELARELAKRQEGQRKMAEQNAEQAARSAKPPETHTVLLTRIRRFFGLSQ